MTDLLDFVEAPARFMAPNPATSVEQTSRFVVEAALGGHWASIEAIRLEEGEAGDALAEVRTLLARTRSRVARWWLSERSTPATAEQELLAAGLKRVEIDYRLDGLLATSPPPPGPPDVEVRRVASAAEWIAVRTLQQDVFGTPSERRASPSEATTEFERTTIVLFGAWLGGELAAAGAATPTSRGMLLWGGATRPEARGRGCYRSLVRARWDEAARRGTPALTVSANDNSGPVLRRLGFEPVVEFRRLEDVLSWP